MNLGSPFKYHSVLCWAGQRLQPQVQTSCCRVQAWHNVTQMLSWLSQSNSLQVPSWGWQPYVHAWSASCCSRFSCCRARPRHLLIFAMTGCLHAGAIVGLAALGSRVVCLLLLPNLQPFLSLLNPHLPSQLQQDPSPSPPARQQSKSSSMPPTTGSNASQSIPGQPAAGGNEPSGSQVQRGVQGGAAATMHPWDARGDEPKGLTGQARQRGLDAVQCRAALLRALGPCLHSIARTG